MDDVAEAKALIAQIRKAKHVDDNDGEDDNVRDLTNSLKLLSEELYSKPAHFMLEIVQNADDNRYDSTTEPKLSFVYREDGYLWIGCNELGFSPENIKAICRIGGSTKKIADSRKGFIGEKGIGFKSVFKVAPIVWVKSGAASFKFDKTKPLGMIAPIWTEFPSNALVDERTMLCLQITDMGHQKTVQSNLLDLKPELLMFLRQLRNIDVTVQKTDGKIHQKFSMRRTENRASSIRLATLEKSVSLPTQRFEKTSFLVCEHTTYGMPMEPKREGVSESNLLIAFPVDDKMQPVVRSCMTFNFLPIRSYGLPFLLQADFVLSANREDILRESKWNDALVSAAIDLFAKSVDIFNAKNVVKYTWPRYLEAQGSTYGTIMHDVHDRLLNKLRNLPVLESQNSTLGRPSALRVVPLRFTDGASPPSPLLVDQTGLNGCVSTSYATKHLSTLRVVPQTDSEFTTLVQRYVTANATAFRSQPNAWHVRLAGALLHIGPKSFLNIPIIPLRDGSWVSAKDGAFYFAEISDGLNVPNGIKVAMISDVASADTTRRKLFQDIGARSLTPAQVVSLILEQHGSHGPQLGDWTVDDVVGHMKFLYKAPSRPGVTELSKLRLAVDGSPLLFRGSELYMDIGSASPIQTLFTGCDAIRFVSRLYLQDSEGDWVRFLQQKIRINTIPRVIDTPNRTLTTESSWLIKTKPSATWLRVLRDHWSHYNVALTTFGNEKARDSLANALVKCKDGKSRCLSKVYLDTPAIAAEPVAMRIAPLLDVEDPRDERWLPLAALGLRVACDLSLYLDVLKTLAGDGTAKFTVADVKRIYSGIQQREFENADLVYVHTAGTRHWVSLAKCKWSAPSCLTSFKALSLFYPEHAALFVHTLGVQNADAADVVNELISLDGQLDKSAEIKALLATLNLRLTKVPGEEYALKQLTHSAARIMVVRDEHDQLGLRSTSGAGWYIADRVRTGKVFSGKLTMLDYTVEEANAVKSLLQKLGLDKRWLNRHVIEITVTDGEKTYQGDLTKILRSKASYITCVIEPNRRPAALKQLSAIEVYSASTLKLRRHVKTSAGVVYGEDEEGFVVVENNNDKLRVYISDAAVAGNKLPYKHLLDRIVDIYNVPADKEVMLLTVLYGDAAASQDVLERAGLLESVVPSASMSAAEIKVDNADCDGVSAMSQQNGVHHSPADVGTGQMLEKDTPSREYGRPAPHTNGTQPSDSPVFAAATPRAAQPKSRRQAQTTSSATGSVVDTSALLAAAAKTDLSSVEVSNRSGVTYGTSRKVKTNGTAQSKSTFNMSSLGAALDPGVDRRSTPRKVGHMNGRVSPAAGSVIGEASYDTPEQQVENGYRGELFVYTLLSHKFQMPADCWTSELRTRARLPAFDDFEGDYADFTIADPAVSKQITQWLTEIGSSTMERWAGRDVTYHIEVKTTTGDREEPFEMSNNQMGLARQWHDCEKDVFVIFRVYDLVKSPKMYVYVDPIARMEEGTLIFTARDGFSVQPV